MSEFDKFSPNYTAILDCDVKFSGENAEYFADYKAQCVRRFLGEAFRGRILDYGCGVGLVAKKLAQYFDPQKTEIFGYDISNGSTKEAAKNIKGVRFTSDLGEISCEPFDVMIIANVLHHIRVEERSGFMRKTAGLLKKGGHIFVFEHNPYNPITRLIVKFSVLDRNTLLLRSGETARLLSEAGVDVFDTKYIVFFPKFLDLFRFLEPMMGGVPIGAQYLCIGKLRERKDD